MGAINALQTEIVSVPSDEAVNEKHDLAVSDAEISKDSTIVLDSEIKTPPPAFDGDEDDSGSENVIIVTGADAAEHLLPMRDDHDPAITFRGLFLATILSGFQAVMTQIYNVSIVTGLCSLYAQGKSRADISSSSNQLKSTSKGLSSSSLPTFLARPGLPFFPEVINLRLDGGDVGDRAKFPYGYLLSPFSTMGPGV
jgi:hypothetical protein